jgi:hypothetical protein
MPPPIKTGIMKVVIMPNGKKGEVINEIQRPWGKQLANVKVYVVKDEDNLTWEALASQCIPVKESKIRAQQLKLDL